MFHYVIKFQVGKCVITLTIGRNPDDSEENLILWCVLISDAER